MTNRIPSILYRGDADSYTIRDLKHTLNLSQLQTNLLKGGTGHAVFSTPMIDLVAKHVDPGWATTHFLSFSEDKATALRFGMGCEYDEVEQKVDSYIEYYEDGFEWTFAVISIDTRCIHWSEISTCIYYGTYQPTLRKFEIYPGIAKVLLVDIRKAIQAYHSHPNYPTVYANAVRDKEWLLLPATEMVMNSGAIEYSGIMDGNCISEIVRYKRVN